MFSPPQLNNVHVFLSKGGHLHEGRKSGNGWTWIDRGDPGGGGAVGQPSALIEDNFAGHVFVRTAAGSASVLSCPNTSTPPDPDWTWNALPARQGVTIAGDPRGVWWEGGHLAMLAISSDKKLLVCERQGASWKWTSHGAPAGVELRTATPAVAAVGEHFTAWVTGTNGKLYRRSHIALGGSWIWQDLGQPNGVKLTGSPALATYLMSPDKDLLFVRGEDGHLYQRVGNSYEDRGLVGNAVVGSPAAAKSVPLNDYPPKFPVRVFFVDYPVVSWLATSKIIEAKFDGSAWAWSQLPNPGGIPFTHHAAAVAVPKLNLIDLGSANPYWVHVFVRGWSGKLYRKLWDDDLAPSWQPLEDLGSP
jgi:hypothetical protein